MDGKLTMKRARELYRKSGIPLSAEKRAEREAAGGHVPGFREWVPGYRSGQARQAPRVPVPCRHDCE